MVKYSCVVNSSEKSSYLHSLTFNFNFPCGRLIYATRIRALHWFCLSFVIKWLTFSDPHWILIVHVLKSLQHIWGLI